MLTFKTTVTEQEIKTAVKIYVMSKLQDELSVDTCEIEITSVKGNKKNFIVQGRQKPKPPEAKKGKARKIKKSETAYLCSECEETYAECDCASGPNCEGCDLPATDCICA